MKGSGLLLSDLNTAIPRDLPEILRLFEVAKAHLREQGVPQWPDDYPDEKQMLDDILARTVWILPRNKRIIACYVLNNFQDKDYADLKWRYTGEKTLVLHRLVVHPEFQGQGIGRALTQRAIDQAIQSQADQLRLDSWSENRISTGMYESLGFEKAEGFCYFHGHPEPFFGFEKDLKGLNG